MKISDGHRSENVTCVRKIHVWCLERSDGRENACYENAQKSYGKCMFSAFPCPVVRHTRRHRNRRRYYAPRTLKCSGPSSALPSSGGPADPAAPRRHSALPLVQRARQFCLRCRCISGSDCASGRNATGSCFTAEKHKKMKHDCAS